MENKEDYKGFLISLDLDDFKMINETYGIGKGNDVICGVWEKIFASLKKNELAARVYSDCFIIYMIGDSKENIEMRLIQLEKSIKELVDVLHVSHIVPKMGVYYLEEKDMDKLRKTGVIGIDENEKVMEDVKNILKEINE